MIVFQTSSRTFRVGWANLLASLAGAAILIGSGVTHAQSADQVYRVTVTYADLDLSTTEGAELLHRRIRSAARRACGWQDWQRPLGRAAWRTCYDDAVLGALAKVHEKAPRAAKLERTT